MWARAPAGGRRRGKRAPPWGATMPHLRGRLGMRLLLGAERRLQACAVSSCWVPLSSALYIMCHCTFFVRRLVSGTSLVAVVSTALAASATYAQSGCVDPAAALLISPAAMLAAPLGARWTARLDCRALRTALGCFLVAVAPLVPLKVRFHKRTFFGMGVESCYPRGTAGGTSLSQVARLL